MIHYDAGKWHLGFIFSLRGSVFQKGVVWAVPATILSIVLHFLAPTINMDADSSVGPVVSSYNFVLGFLIVFRTQQAYGRFADGAALLQQVTGVWLCAAQSMIAFSSRKEEHKHKVAEFQHLVVRLFSLLQCAALQRVGDLSDESFQVFSPEGIEPACLEYLATKEHERVEVILQWLQSLIVEHMGSGVLPIAPPIMSRVFQELETGIVKLHYIAGAFGCFVIGIHVFGGSDEKPAPDQVLLHHRLCSD